MASIPSIPAWTLPQTTLNSWGSIQPMDLKTDCNSNYKNISKDFIQKYISANSLGVFSVAYLYDVNAIISFNIQNSDSTQLFEIVGYENFKNKLSEFNVYAIRFKNLDYVSQPFSKNSAIITAYGKAEICSTGFSVITTFTLEFCDNNYKIVNHILSLHQ